MNKKERRQNARAKIENEISQRGGYSRKTLESMGVPWPPQKGWKNRLIDQAMGIKRKLNCKSRSNFYGSWEWKRARYEALRLHGHRCQCCGWAPGDTSHGYLVVDHIKPRSKHPHLALEIGNLQVLCNDCNQGKSNVYEDDFRDIDEWLKTIAHDP